MLPKEEKCGRILIRVGEEATKMKLKEIYQLAIEKGIKNDPRGQKTVEKYLARLKKDYEEMKEEDKKEYDLQKLINPYADTRILYGEENKEIKKALVGIDVEVGEVLLADRLREKGEQIDLVIAHHPEGQALARLHDVMHLQEDIMHMLGVPINVAEGIMAPRIAEVERALMPGNHNRAVDAAAILDIPMMCIHTPADNHVNSFLMQEVETKKPETLRELVKMLKEIPEYAQAARRGAGPRIIIGAEQKRAGKIFIDMTGGTGGPKEAFEKLALAGVGTVVCMHISDNNRKEAEKYHINVVIAGHIASDSLGMNLILDKLEKKGIEIIPCAGLIRIKR